MDRARQGAVPAAVRPDSPAQAAENTAVTLLNGLLDGAGFQPGRRAGQRAALWNDGKRTVSPGEANALPQRVAGLLADGVSAGVVAGGLWAILRARFSAAPLGVLPAAITLDEVRAACAAPAAVPIRILRGVETALRDVGMTLDAGVLPYNSDENS